MKAKDIQAALAVDADTVFALRPDYHTVKVIRVRGLRPSKKAGHWDYSMCTNTPTGAWTEGQAFPIASRDLCPLDVAVAEMAKRCSDSARKVTAIYTSDRCVMLLDQLGVQAKRSYGMVVVEDVLALEVLLDRFAGHTE
jgi:hypothetical protein